MREEKESRREAFSSTHSGHVSGHRNAPYLLSLPSFSAFVITKHAFKHKHTIPFLPPPFHPSLSFLCRPSCQSCNVIPLLSLYNLAPVRSVLPVTKRSTFCWTLFEGASFIPAYVQRTQPSRNNDFSMCDCAGKGVCVCVSKSPGPHLHCVLDG